MFSVGTIVNSHFCVAERSCSFNCFVFILSSKGLSFNQSISPILQCITIMQFFCVKIYSKYYFGFVINNKEGGIFYLILAIFLSCILGFLLLMLHPLFGGILAFGIITGSLFRGLYLLNEIHKHLLKDEVKRDKVQAAYESYLKEREEKNEG